MIAPLPLAPAGGRMLFRGEPGKQKEKHEKTLQSTHAETACFHVIQGFDSFCNGLLAQAQGFCGHYGGIDTMQRFIARERYAFANGAIGWRPGGPFDCLGPYAKVQNVPIHGTEWRLTAYAQGYADTYFSIPAATRKNGIRIKGFFSQDGDGGCVFRPYKGELEKVKQ